MATEFRWLKLRQLGTRLTPWRRAATHAPRPKEGWIRAIRQALGMGTEAYAARLGTRQPWVMQLEHAELKGTLTLASLEKAAAALDCDFVYALVPRRPLEQAVKEQAANAARRLVKEVSHSMALEQQRPSRAVEARQQKTLERRLLDGPWRRLWK